MKSSNKKQYTLFDDALIDWDRAGGKKHLSVKMVQLLIDSMIGEILKLRRRVKELERGSRG